MRFNCANGLVALHICAAAHLRGNIASQQWWRNNAKRVVLSWLLSFDGSGRHPSKTADSFKYGVAPKNALEIISLLAYFQFYIKSSKTFLFWFVKPICFATPNLHFPTHSWRRPVLNDLRFLVLRKWKRILNGLHFEAWSRPDPDIFEAWYRPKRQIYRAGKGLRRQTDIFI